MLIAGLAGFFLPHAYSAFRSRSEDAFAARKRALYMSLYSLVSAAGLVALIWGFAAGRPWPEVWTPPVWTRHVVEALMLPAMIFIVAAYAPPGHIKTWVKHPMLTAVMLWAFAHLCANGDLGSVLLFGSFLAFAVVDRVVVSARGLDVSLQASHKMIGDVVAVAGGLVAYGLFGALLHPILIGVRAFG